MMKFAMLVLLILLSHYSFAGPEAEVKYRQGVMSAVGGHMKSMGAILKGQVHMSDLQFHARSMANISSIVPHVFPIESAEGKTEALPAIWENPADFKLVLDDFLEAADKMAVATESAEMDSIGPAMKALGDACKACHDDYKEE